MIQYFKETFGQENHLEVFYAYHNAPENESEYNYCIRERVHYNPQWPYLSNYGAGSYSYQVSDLTPCSKEEFEAAKTAALTAIASLMAEPQLQAA